MTSKGLLSSEVTTSVPCKLPQLQPTAHLPPHHLKKMRTYVQVVWHVAISA